MEVLIEESFRKDIFKIKSKTPYAKIANIIEEFQTADKLSEVSNIKKLKGFRNDVRIKVGDYRLGFEYANRKIIFHRFLHRKIS